MRSQLRTGVRITHDTGDDDGDDMTMNVRPRVGGSNEEPSAVQYVITRASNEPSRRSQRRTLLLLLVERAY